jgi:hypothetical protein
MRPMTYPDSGPRQRVKWQTPANQRLNRNKNSQPDQSTGPSRKLVWGELE